MRSPTKTSVKPIVQLRRERQRLFMNPVVPDVLNRLTTAKHVLVNGDRGCRIVPAVQTLDPCIEQVEGLKKIGLVDVPSRTNTVMAGLEPVVRRLLSERGYNVIPSAPVPRLPVPDLEAVRAHGIVDRPMLDAIRLHGRLIVRYGHQVDKAWLIAQTALAYPQASIVVSVARRAEANRLGEQLRRWVRDVTVLTGDRREPKTTGRVVVAMYRTLGLPALRTAHRDIYIAAHAIESLGADGKLGLDEAMRARYVGLLSDSARLAPRDSDELHGYFGFQEVGIPAHGKQLLPVDLVFLRMGGGPKCAFNGNWFELRKMAVWNNPLRNRRIAKLATRLAAGDYESLARDFPAMAGIAWPRTSCRVAVLVDGPLQALPLLWLSPDWHLTSIDGINMKGLSYSDCRALTYAARPQADSSSVQVVTTAALNKLDLQQIDVLVRADAGTGGIQLAQTQVVVDSSYNRRLLLVDFDDRTQPQLRRWSRQRRHAYQAAGWYAPGTDPVQHRIEQFIASRPQGKQNG